MIFPNFKLNKKSEMLLRNALVSLHTALNKNRKKKMVKPKIYKKKTKGRKRLSAKPIVQKENIWIVVETHMNGKRPILKAMQRWHFSFVRVRVQNSSNLI